MKKYEEIMGKMVLYSINLDDQFKKYDCLLSFYLHSSIHSDSRRYLTNPL